MKIGILTLPLHTNYGGILQAFALTKVLKDKGHEVWLIDKSRSGRLPLSKMPVMYTKRFIKKFILRRPATYIFSEQKSLREYPVISQHTQSFIEKYIPKRETLPSPNALPKNSFEAIFVGSDQIWRPKYYPVIENAYLKFTQSWDNGVRRVSYAPSFGTENWEYLPAQTEECGALLRRFHAVSAREISGVRLCKEKFGVDAEHVLDPTMLLDVSVYIDMIKNYAKSSGNLLTYLLDLDEGKQKIVDDVADIKGLKAFKINSKTEDHTAKLEERIAPPIEQWLRGFYDAEFVITDSFHACAFSILFNKPFIVYGNKSRGLARFLSLLSIFGLEDRLISAPQELTDEKIKQPINWHNVNNILEERRKQSNIFIDNALN